MSFRPSRARPNRRRRWTNPVLTLTPMVDAFVCLLCFLLQSYSMSESVVASDQTFHLPVSESRVDPRPAITIKVNNDVIVMDGAVIATTPGVLRQEELLIRPLFEALQKKADRSRFISERNQTVRFRGDIIIQGDRNISFSLLKKIMFTCSRAEYGNIALAVLQKEG